MPAAIATCPARLPRLGRKRRVAGGVLIVIGVLIAGVWGASRWWYFGYWGGWWRLGASGGAITVDWRETGWLFPQSWFGTRRPVSWGWTWLIWTDEPIAAIRVKNRVNLFLFEWRRETIVLGGFSSSRDQSYVQVIPWPFALTALTTGTWLVLSARRARGRAITNACLNCGYDLAGISPNSPCPECGGDQLTRAVPEGSPAR